MDDLTLHAGRSALLTIDVQNDFVRPGAVAEIQGTQDAVPAMRQLVDSFRRHGRPVIHMVRLYLPDGSNVDPVRRAAVRAGRLIVAPGSDGAQLVDELTPGSNAPLDSDRLLAGKPQQLGQDEWVIYKPRWGAFYETPLAGHLANLSVDSLVVCGCNYPNCPRTTVYEASERDFRLGLATDATSGLYGRAEAELQTIGVHLCTAGECSEWLSDRLG